MTALSSKFDYQGWAKELAANIDDLNQVFGGVRHNARQRYGAYLLALSMIDRALTALPGTSGGSSPIQDLARRLDGLAAGQKKALLPLSRPKGGRPDYSIFDWHTVGKAAAVVDFLVLREMSEDTACSQVADVLRSFKVKGRRGENVSASAVRDWRSGTGSYGDKTEARAVFLSTAHTLKPHLSATMSASQLRKLLKIVLRPFGNPLERPVSD